MAETEHTYEELKKTTVADLREIAAGIDHPAVQGYTQMNKEHLIPAICEALGIDTYVHHHAEGIDKTSIKREIRALKAQRDAILASDEKDYDELRRIRRGIHRRKHELRRAMV